MDTYQFNLDTDYIEMVKLIKLYSKGLSGGEIKTMIEQGLILRNGDTEFRKRAKLRKGDVITFFENKIEII